MESITLEDLHKELLGLKKELKRLSLILEEDFELSDEAKKELSEARKEPLTSYVDHEEVLKEAKGSRMSVFFLMLEHFIPRCRQ